MEKKQSEIAQGKAHPTKASFQCMDAIEISLHIEKEGLFFYE